MPAGILEGQQRRSTLSPEPLEGFSGALKAERRRALRSGYADRMETARNWRKQIPPTWMGKNMNKLFICVLTCNQERGHDVYVLMKKVMGGVVGATSTG